MRISTAWSQQLNVNAMADRQTQLAKAQQQLSSGLRVSAPADDPAAAVRILDLNQTITKTNQYQSNISTATGRLNIEESALATSGNILTRAKELTMQGMNDSLNSSDRLSLKYEVDQMIQELAGVANTKNANGEYIFSGDLATVPAFAINPKTGEYVYQGGPEQRALQISPTRQVADGDLGFNVFQNVNSSSPAADENGKRSIFNTLKALSEGLGATFNATPGVITGDRFLRYGLDYTNPLPPTTFNLVANAQVAPATVPPTAYPLSPATIDLTGKKFAGVEDIVTEINNQLAAAPLLPADMAPNTNLPVGSHFSDAIQARSNGNKIEFVSVATGATSSITISNTSGSFLTDAGFPSPGVPQVDGKATETFLGVAGGGLAATDFSVTTAQFNVGAANIPVNLNANYANANAVAAAIQTQLQAVDPTYTVSQVGGAFTITHTGAVGPVAISGATPNAIAAGFVNTAGTPGIAAGYTMGGVDVPTLPVQVLQKQLGDVLTDLDSGLNSVLEARTSVGIRLNALDDQKSQNDKFVLDTQKTLSETQDLDYAEAASRFQLQSTALQAAQQAFAQIKGLSLFKYL